MPTNSLVITSQPSNAVTGLPPNAVFKATWNTFPVLCIANLVIFNNKTRIRSVIHFYSSLHLNWDHLGDIFSSRSLLQPSMWNKDTIHWLTGPITVDLGRGGRKHENICWFRLLQNLRPCLDEFKCEFWVSCLALNNTICEHYPFQMNLKKHWCIKWHSLLLKTHTKAWFLTGTR